MATLPAFDFRDPSGPAPEAFAFLDEVFPSALPPPDAAPSPDAPALLPGLLHLTAEQEERLVRQVRAHYEEGTQAREERTQLREVRYRRYLADASLRGGKQLWEEAPRIFTPLTHQTLETLKDELTEAIGPVASLSVRGIGDEDAQRSGAVTAFIRYGLTDINPVPWEDLVDGAIHLALQDDVGILKVYPYHEPFPRRMAGGALLDTIIRVDLVDEGTLLLPANHTGWQWPECTFISHQLWIAPDEMQAMGARGFTVPVSEDFARMGDPQQHTDDERKLLEFTRQGLDPDLASATDPQIELVESYELFAMHLGAPREFIVVHWFPHVRSRSGRQAGTVARAMLLREALKQETFPHERWPFFPVTVWPQPHQARGMSLVDKLETAQDMQNRLAEQMIAQGEIDVLPFVFANLALAGDLPNLRHIKPGDIVPIDSTGAVHFSPRQSNTRHYIEQMQVASTWAEQASGVTAYAQGRTPDQPNVSRTLGGMALMLQQGQKGFKKQTHHIARQLREAVKMYAGLWQAHIRPTLQFPTTDASALATRVFQGGDDSGLRMMAIEEPQWQGVFDFQVKVNPEALLEQQKRLMLAEKLDAILAPIFPLGQRELWRDIWETLGMQEFERFWPEEVATMQTLLLTLQVQLQLAQLEGAVAQASMPPPPLPEISARASGVEAAPPPAGAASQSTPFAGLINGLSGMFGGTTPPTVGGI
jgi:hypothetical protein